MGGAATKPYKACGERYGNVNCAHTEEFRNKCVWWNDLDVSWYGAPPGWTTPRCYDYETMHNFYKCSERGEGGCKNEEGKWQPDNCVWNSKNKKCSEKTEREDLMFNPVEELLETINHNRWDKDESSNNY